MSAYIAPGLIPEVRRVIISDKIIAQQLSRKPLIKTVCKTRPYKTYFVKASTDSEKQAERDWQRIYRLLNKQRIAKYQKEYYRANKQKIKVKKITKSTQPT